MNTLTSVTLGIFGFISGVILLTAFLSPIHRKIGFRNIYRRLGNTILVVIGSLVGSALIAGSLVLSDSLDKTFFNIVENAMGESDLSIDFSEKELFDEGIVYITRDEYEEIEGMLDIEEVDGVFPALSLNVAPQKLDAEGNPVINVYMVQLYGLSVEELATFGTEPQIFDSISDNEVIISDLLARKLELSEGDTIRAGYGFANIDMTVKRIYEEKGLIGGKSIFARNEFLTSQLGLPENAYNTIMVSAKGGIRPDNYIGEDFENTVKEAIAPFESDRVSLTTQEWKQEALNGFGMKTFIIIFFVLSLFGIFSGILLIVNLYSMLAEERKMEMGILRAIALTRAGLTKAFIYEGFVYSLISSFIGSIVGLGIGYALVKGLGIIFDLVLSASGDEDFLKIAFGFKIQSLVIAFCVGFIITIITAIISSIRISRLNIVSAIRNLEERKEIKITPRWIFVTRKKALKTRWKLLKFALKSPIKWLRRKFPEEIKDQMRAQKSDNRKLLGWSIVTILNIFFFFSSLMTLMTFFSIRQMMETARDQGGEGNQLTEMSVSQFTDMVNLTQSMLLYFGFIMTVFSGIGLLNRVIPMIIKRDLKRVTWSIASIVLVLFSAFITRFESMVEALDQDAGAVIFFASSVVMVVSLSLLVTYNLEVITTILSKILSPISGLRSVVKIALRYPSESRSKTGLTLIMFALVIFLISYVSMVKGTMNQVLKVALENSLGGYDLLIYPAPDVPQELINDFSADIETIEDVEKTAGLSQVLITLPDFIYKDLPAAPYFGDPTDIPFHTEDDTFRTYYNAVPGDYLKNVELKLGERLDEFSDDEAVWDAVIDDPTNIVLGVAFEAQGFGQQPDIALGEEIQVANLFGEGETTKRVIGKMPADDMSSPGMGAMYSYIITTSEHVYEELDPEYVEGFSQKIVLAQFSDGANKNEVTNKIKKELIQYNIVQITELEDLTGTALGMMNALMAMFQGFLAFSLVVGTSGLAIIITRAVHERRQQIGMLRSLGFQRWMILVSFFIESTFITILGIAIGISMGTIGALSAFDVAFRDQPDVSPIFPVAEIAFICVAVYVAAMIFAILPSIRASRLSPVEATNYPE